jgi:hypothetical protein
MKKPYFVLALILGIAIGAAAQSGIWRGAAVIFPVDATIPLASCATQQAPLVGVTYYCTTGMGEAISCNGAPYVNGVVCGGSSGVASISVNGGQPQTGPVALTIPSKATSTATAPNPSFAANGVLTLSAPTVTTTIQ